MDFFEGFLYGVFGGVLAQLLGLFKLRHSTRASLPDWLRSPFYWIVTGLMILCGGGLVVIYLRSNVMLNAFFAVNVGASAPVILEMFVAQTPRIDPGRIN